MNIESHLVAAFNAEASVPEAFTEVPATRPKRFLIVERVGGDQVDVRDRPRVAVGVWDESRWKASESALTVAAFLRSLAVTDPNIAKVSIESIYNNPDPASDSPRFQVNATLITT